MTNESFYIYCAVFPRVNYILHVGGLMISMLDSGASG